MIGGGEQKVAEIKKDTSKDAREARIIAFKNKHTSGNAGYDMQPDGNKEYGKLE